MVIFLRKYIILCITCLQWLTCSNIYTESHAFKINNRFSVKGKRI